LNKKDGEYCFELVLRTIDTNSFEITVCPSFTMMDFENLDDFKVYLAHAMMKDVPIYANTPALQSDLESLQEDILKNGIAVEHEGRRIGYRVRKYNSLNFEEGIEALRSLSHSSLIIPGALKIIDEKMSTVLHQYAHAAQFVDLIEEAIKNLETLLLSETRNENKLQSHLVENPILFGTEYKHILPKHKLGAEYEMDYALERFDGVFDLVEIEASNLPLYTQTYNPSQYLVHAEQQILDWQEWLEEKNFYAREHLKDIRNPKGFVIIGRNNSLDEAARKRLCRRNLVFNGKIQIMTYDDLLSKSKTLLRNIRSGEYSVV
jgi:hypothetical protein